MAFPHWILGQDFKSVGLSTFNEILNVVAPPIAEHEVISVLVSHDMRGYDGVESLVYQALSKVFFFATLNWLVPHDDDR